MQLVSVRVCVCVCVSGRASNGCLFLLLGLIVVVKSLMVFSLTRLMTKNLPSTTVSLKATKLVKCRAWLGHSRQTDSQHDAREHLSPPTKVQLPDPRPGKCNEPQIQGDSSPGGRPREGVGVSAVTLYGSLFIPLIPEETCRLALQNNGKSERRDVNGVEDTRPINETVGRVVGGSREDTKVEKDDGGAYKAPRHSVQAHIDPEYEQKPGYVVKWERPDVTTHAESSGTDICRGEGGAARLFVC